MDDCLTVVGHQADQRCIPFVRDFREGGRPACHQDLPHSVLESFQRIIVNTDESMRGNLLRYLILQLPDSLLGRKLLLQQPYLRQDPHFKAAHREQQIRIISTINRDKGLLPVDSRNATRQPILDLPEHAAAKVHVMFHQSHPAILWPAFLVVVADYVLVVRVWVFG